MRKIELTENTIIKRIEDILASDVDGEKVMMSIKRGEYYGLAKTGTFIWDHIEKPIQISDLITLITNKFEVSREKCFNDIKPFLTDLIEKELIIATI